METGFILNKDTYTKDEVLAMLETNTVIIAENCAEYCDRMRGMLSIGHDIRHHYGVNLVAPDDGATKQATTKLRSVK